jgi:hypothetical protein
MRDEIGMSGIIAKKIIGELKNDRIR